MEKHVDVEVEKTNILNNLKVVLQNAEYATCEGVVTDFKINYSSYINARLNSALQSMMNLYMNGDITYHAFNGYLILHHRVRDTYIQLIHIQTYRTVIQQDFFSLPIKRHVEMLLEQARFELKQLA